LLLRGFVLDRGPVPLRPATEHTFLLTESFEKYLADLLRAITSNLPVLLEGPTSSGKTSLVKHLAELTGHKCVRVNNHQHTDVEEYVGTYLPDARGRLVFHEGVLVRAL
jgi:midasin